jgi:hypothetical protein
MALLSHWKRYTIALHAIASMNLHALALKSLCNRYTIAAQKHCVCFTAASHSVNAAQSLGNRRSLALQLLYDRSINSLQLFGSLLSILITTKLLLLCYCSAIVLELFCYRRGIIVESLCNCSTIAMQPLCDRLAVALFSLCNRNS